MCNKKSWRIWITGVFPPGPAVNEESVEPIMMDIAMEAAKLLGLEPELLRIYGGPNDPKGWGIYHEKMNGGPWPYAEPVDNDEEDDKKGR